VAALRSAQSDATLLNPLKASGLIDSVGIEEAKQEAKRRKCTLIDAILALNLISERAFLKVFADLYATRFLKAESLSMVELSSSLTEVISREDALLLKVCPLRYSEDESELHVVASVPISPSLEPKLRAKKQVKSVLIFVATPAAVSALCQRLWHKDSSGFARIANGSFVDTSVQIPQLQLTQDESNTDDPTPHRGTHKVDGQTAFRENGVAAQIKVNPLVQEPPTVVLPEAHRTPGVAKPVEGKTVMVSVESLTIDALKKENARYRIAQELNKRVSLERSTTAMIDKILQATFELFPCERAAILLNDGTWRSAQRNGSSDPVEIPKKMVSEAMESKAGVLTHDALLDARFDRSKSVVLSGIRSAMTVPLRTASATLGVLYADSSAFSAAFQAVDLPLFDALGAQAALMIENAGLIAQVQREVETRANLSRFLSAAAVDEVMSGRTTMNMEGEQAQVTVLFADIRGFTNMSSHMAAPAVVKFLNDFFHEAVTAVENHGGIVDKFIGDCVMALWGAVNTSESDSRNAINAALEMVERSKKILVQGVPLEIGIGINSGLAVVGAIGGQRRLDYTAIGATVNLAARLCGIAPTDCVLITSDTLMQSGPGVEVVPDKPVLLKGIDVPIVPYRVKSVSKPLKLIE
jgi:adenylate cyclase